MALDRALLANIDVYFAEGNVRHGLASFANNVLVANDYEQLQERRVLLGAGKSVTVQSPGANSATIIRCSKPIKVTCTVLPSGTPTVFSVTSLFVYTGEVGDLTIANDSVSVDSKVTIIQV